MVLGEAGGGVDGSAAGVGLGGPNLNFDPNFDFHGVDNVWFEFAADAFYALQREGLPLVPRYYEQAIVERAKVALWYAGGGATAKSRFGLFARHFAAKQVAYYLG